jgi:hypothetical protein
MPNSRFILLTDYPFELETNSLRLVGLNVKIDTVTIDQNNDKRKRKDLSNE